MLNRHGTLPLFLLTILLFHPSALAGQTCVGLPPEQNRVELAVGVEGQNDGQRLGAWAHANIAGRIGILFGASVGTIDRFAEGGNELRGLVSVSLSFNPYSTCLFVEYEQAREPFRNAFEVSSGDYIERWTRLGWAVGKGLAQFGEVRFSVHAAPELIWRITQTEGRTLYLDPPPGHVLSTNKRETAVHLGGRVLVSARHPRLSFIVGVKNRPRILSDLQWAMHVGFPI